MYRWSYSQWIVAAGFSIWGFSHDAKTARPIRAQPCTIQSACRAALPGPPLPARRLLCLCLPRSLSKPLFYQQPFSSIITAVEFQGVMGQSRSILLCISCFYKNYRTDLNTKKGEQKDCSDNTQSTECVFLCVCHSLVFYITAHTFCLSSVVFDTVRNAHQTKRAGCHVNMLFVISLLFTSSSGLFGTQPFQCNLNS